MCLHTSRSAPRPARGRGFTILELMLAVVVIGLLVAIALPSYSGIVERQKVAEARRELIEIALVIEKFRTVRFATPETLAELGLNADLLVDPWGREYQFLSFDSSMSGIKGKIRKDHNLHPLNSAFDLYSFGEDGKSQSPLTAKASRDDVIWARDGAFVGLAEDY